MMRDTNPYSTASWADSQWSRSMSTNTSSNGLPVSRPPGVRIAYRAGTARRGHFSALPAGTADAIVEAAPVPQGVTCGGMQVGGQLGLVLTLDGVRLCVVPLGTRREAVD